MTFIHLSVNTVVKASKESDTKNFCLQNFGKFYPYHIQRANDVDLDEAAHDEPPHLDLSCLQMYLFSSFEALSDNPLYTVIVQIFRGVLKFTIFVVSIKART